MTVMVSFDELLPRRGTQEPTLYAAIRTDMLYAVHAWTGVIHASIGVEWKQPMPPTPGGLCPSQRNLQPHGVNQTRAETHAILELWLVKTGDKPRKGNDNSKIAGEGEGKGGG